jgi:hypothetical protein
MLSNIKTLEATTMKPSSKTIKECTALRTKKNCWLKVLIYGRYRSSMKVGRRTKRVKSQIWKLNQMSNLP